MQHRVLAIVVCYNAMQWIDRCLGSVRRSGIDGIVIDNGSSDGTVQHVETNFPEMRLLTCKNNPGFGAANNIGLKAALEEGYDYVYLLNQDAWLEENTIEKLLASASDEYAILSPVQTDSNGQLDLQFAKKCGPAIDSGRIDSLGRVEVPFVMAAHWLISRKAILDVGGFSPAFRQYGEDDNWIHRAHYFGYRTGVVPNAFAVHDRAGRTTTKEKRMKLKCVSTVVKLSNPCTNLTFRKIVEPIELLGISVKNGSFIPLKYLPTLLHRYPELSLLREESKRQKAFL